MIETAFKKKTSVLQVENERTFDLQLKVNFNNGDVNVSLPLVSNCSSPSSQLNSPFYPYEFKQEQIKKINESDCTLISQKEEESIDCVICKRSITQKDFQEHLNYHRNKNKHSMTSSSTIVSTKSSIIFNPRNYQSLKQTPYQHQSCFQNQKTFQQRPSHQFPLSLRTSRVVQNHQKPSLFHSSFIQRSQISYNNENTLFQSVPLTTRYTSPSFVTYNQPSSPPVYYSPPIQANSFNQRRCIVIPTQIQNQSPEMMRNSRISNASIHSNRPPFNEEVSFCKPPSQRQMIITTTNVQVVQPTQNKVLHKESNVSFNKNVINQSRLSHNNQSKQSESSIDARNMLNQSMSSIPSREQRSDITFNSEVNNSNEFEIYKSQIVMKSSGSHFWHSEGSQKKATIKQKIPLNYLAREEFISQNNDTKSLK